jgi:uncharacterized protein YndB with AHSA1/START domain
MAASEFHLVTEWVVAAPQAAVWEALTHPEEWPAWWRAVERVELLEPGDANGLGAYRRFIWRTALPYRIRFNMRLTRIEPMTLIEGRADGELSGVGRWALTPQIGRADEGTRVRYDWIVAVDRAWMRALSPVLRPVFVWNHRCVMAWGHEGLARKLAQRGAGGPTTTPEGLSPR